MSEFVELYDTTLRDGTQAEDFVLSVDDKIKVAKRLDELGIHYIEGGWPFSNPKDIAFFEQIKAHPMKQAKIAAFGSTCHPSSEPEKDKNLNLLLDAKTDAITIFGKSWTVHVTDALKTTLERNVEIIRGSVAFLKENCPEVIYDAEHFFDGFKANSEYALRTLRAAYEGGAKVLVLCDTNGGSLPWDVARIIERVKEELPGAALGIHAHNDSETGVANSLAAVEAGATHVQGTINGVGERCGNADLCSIIPCLMLKMGKSCLTDEQLKTLRPASRFVTEIANQVPNRYQPFVGRSAFTHKGGVHIDAVMKNPITYEHIEPELVGNQRRAVVSDLSGRAAIIYKAKELGIDLSKEDPAALQVLNEIKEREMEGFLYEAAEASFELLLNKARGVGKEYFELLGYRVIDVKRSHDDHPVIEASIMVRVDSRVEHTAALGNGPVNALDQALRKALEKFYSQLGEMSLADYKVRVLPGDQGTGAKVRVLIESTDGRDWWQTVGVSNDILEASWMALADSYTYKLYKDEKKA